MRTLFRSLLALLCFSAPLSARTSALALPSLDRSAVAMASGEAGSFLTGLDALGTNPAGLYAARREWNATYRQMPLETNLSGTALCWPLLSIHTTLAVSYSALRSADIEGRTLSGERAGSFQQEDQMIGLHGAHRFLWGEMEILGGASVKGIQSRIDRYSGSGFALDFGVRAPFKKIPLTLAVTALNVGEGPKLIAERAALPTAYGLSGTYHVAPPFALFGGVAYQPHQTISNVTVGGEYRVGSLLAFRGHYAAGTGAEGNEGMGQLVGGMGIYFGKIRLDYTFQPAGEELSDAGASATQHATLTLEF